MNHFMYHLDRAGSNIVYLSGLNIEQRTIGYGWRQNQEAKLEIVEGDLS